MPTASSPRIAIPAEVMEARDRLFSAMDAVETCRPVPEAEPLYSDGHLELWQDEFRFTTPGGIVFSYSLGERLAIAPFPKELRGEVELFQWGTVFGAVAWLQRLVPLHASAVVCTGHAVGFTADSGAGKSTLAVGLAGRGWPYLCDDTLVVVPHTAGLFALSDGKRAKLWRETADALSIDIADEIALVPGKGYAAPRQAAAPVVELRDLILLADGDEACLVPLTGSARIELVGSALYRAFIPAEITDPVMHAQSVLDISSRLRCWRLSRPRHEGLLAENVASVAELIETKLR